MASLKLSDLVGLTEYLVGDPQQSAFKPEMYNDAINFAIKNYATKTGATYLEVAVTPTSDGFCSLTSSYLRLQRVSYGGVLANQVTTTVKELSESTFNFESMKSPEWQVATAVTPKRWVLWSGSKVKITPIPTPLVYPAVIGIVEDPGDLSNVSAVIATSLIPGRSYRIDTASGTTWTSYGATTGVSGEEFVVTSVPTGTGTAFEIVDLRIPPAHQEYLKYAAAAWLFMLDGDGEDIAKSETCMQKFNQLIGYTDPVLELKLQQARTQAIREM